MSGCKLRTPFGTGKVEMAPVTTPVEGTPPPTGGTGRLPTGFTAGRAPVTALTGIRVDIFGMDTIVGVLTARTLEVIDDSAAVAGRIDVGSALTGRTEVTGTGGSPGRPSCGRGAGAAIAGMMRVIIGMMNRIIVETVVGALGVIE